MKYEAKKELKQIFGTKQKPSTFELPTLRFLTINGKGNPNNLTFQKHVQALYAVMYTAKFDYKKSPTHEQWSDFTVAPLMAWWTISEEAIQRGTFTKDDFVYELRILIPYFVPDEVVKTSIIKAKEKKGFPEIDEVSIKEYPKMPVAQILHVGTYDDEPQTFEKLEQFLLEQGLKRKSKNHVEIYLSDPRKIVPQKLKTILQVEV
ncbi:MAG: GyrI-like domain-containing protein [Streptococcaceae bacterium]|jgi:hypothetical protein|nr:GyrI-like domain-containing protein [Streptococcaceae bacterium]